MDRRDSREKMICRILLLIQLISCVCGTFVVNVTQSSYQAEENDHITLEWTFTTKADTSINSIYVYCELFTDLKAPCVFHLHEGVEVPECQDEQFAGRVQWDKDVLRGGRIRLHVSRLRINDSGLYLCAVKTDDGSKSGSCHLTVTAVRDRPEPERPNTASRGRIVLYCGLTAAVLSVCSLLFIYCLLRNKIRPPDVSRGGLEKPDQPPVYEPIPKKNMDSFCLADDKTEYQETSNIPTLALHTHDMSETENSLIRHI